MHVHILIIVWHHKQADYNTHTHAHIATQGHPDVHITIPKSEADMVSQVDMYTCTDACTHFNQGVGPMVGDWDTHTHTLSHREIQVSM